MIRSTVQPGTVEEKIEPILERASGKKSGVDFGLCFQPEFLREGSSIRDYDHPPYTIVGGNCEAAVNAVRELFQHLDARFLVTNIRVAETLKMSCNAFHALKITFANEIGRVSQALGIDSHEVMRLVCADKRLNISPAYLKPGFAFGGSCLPKDLRALTNIAKQNDIELPMLSSLLVSNRVHIDHAVDKILKLGRPKVGMLGLSFKTGTDDLRESPLVLVAKRLLGEGCELRIFDPEVQLSRLLGANRSYIDAQHSASRLAAVPGHRIDDRSVGRHPGGPAAVRAQRCAAGARAPGSLRPRSGEPAESRPAALPVRRHLLVAIRARDGVPAYIRECAAGAWCHVTDSDASG